VTYIVKRRSGDIAVGITASKKVGGAVQRNRARRVVKAALMQVLEGKTGTYDLVVVCRKAILEKKSTEIAPILRAHLRKAGVLN